MKRACRIVILVTGLISITYGQNSYLVGWWKFDEGSGTVADDSSGNWHQGVFIGNPNWVTGKTGGGLLFDGIDDYVDTDFTENLMTWTISVWVQSPSAPSEGWASGPVHREQNFQLNWNHPDPSFRGAAALAVGGIWYPASFGSLEANTWYQLAATYDGETLKSYTNGILVTSNEAPSGPPTPEANSLKFGRHAAYAQFFTGTIDGVRIYNRALTEEEISNLGPIHYSGGSGTVSNPFRISTVADWQALIATPTDWDKYFVLMNDINFGGISITPVGTDNMNFTGSFNGNYHVLTNYEINLPDSDYVGLFGIINSGGRVRNLILEGFSVKGKYHVGGLCGHNGGSESYIQNVGLSFFSVTGNYHVGGLCGRNSGMIVGCYVWVGGEVNGDFLSDQIGGLVGLNDGGSIHSCYSVCKVSGNHNVGGLCGTNWFQSTIRQCYSTGKVAGVAECGGLCALNANTIEDCFWDTQTSGINQSDGGIGKTMFEMTTLWTFISTGWDFVGEISNGTQDPWRLCSVGYPRLSWEFAQVGDYACPDGIDLGDLFCLAGRWLADTPDEVGAADGTGDGRVNLEDFVLTADRWGRRVENPLGLEFVPIIDPPFSANICKYETTNTQYCQFLNAALVSGDIQVSTDESKVFGAIGVNGGEDYPIMPYYNLVAGHIKYSDGRFYLSNPSYSDHPVNYVSYFGAMAFCNYYGYRLPHYVEWQAVADYDGTYRYGCGPDINNTLANYQGSYHPNSTTPVGFFGLYGYGLADLAGNVAEWTTTTLGAQQYIICGGAWNQSSSECLVYPQFHRYAEGSSMHDHIGFRACMGPEMMGMVAVPNLFNQSRDQAQVLLIEAGLVEGTVIAEYNNTIAAGSIISQNPQMGVFVPQGSLVNLIVSKGRIQVTVPDVVGITRADAVAAISAAGLVMGTATEEFNSAIANGLVISQYPPGGSSAPWGSGVNLVVSKGILEIEWITIQDPGVSGHEGFSSQMSKYETTNAQYCRFLNSALASGDITIDGNGVVGANGSNTGADFVGSFYYNLAGAGETYNGANNGGAARIHFSNGSFTVDSGFDNHPVTWVSWYGATAFCNYYGYQLPSEWEWQAVADFLGEFTYGCGTSITNSKANCYDSTHPNGTRTVGAFGIYGYGLCDMSGNVWEWTSSCYYSDCRENMRTIRGGSWYNLNTACSVSNRTGSWPYWFSHVIGFRVCRNNVNDAIDPARVSYVIDGSTPAYSGRPDNTGDDLANGIVANANFEDLDWVEWAPDVFSPAMPAYAYLKFDLGSVHNLEQVVVTFLNYPEAGVYTPEKMDLRFSIDKITWTEWTERKGFMGGNSPVNTNAFALDETARYVEIKVHCNGDFASRAIFLSEIAYY